MGQHDPSPQRPPTRRRGSVVAVAPVVVSLGGEGWRFPNEKRLLGASVDLTDATHRILVTVNVYF